MRGILGSRRPGESDTHQQIREARAHNAHDYDSVIIPALEARFSRQKKVRFLYHLGEEFTGLEVGAMWDDTKLGLKHFSGREELAVVSDITWVRVAIEAFGLALPGRVRVFHDNELAEAKRWVAE